MGNPIQVVFDAAGPRALGATIVGEFEEAGGTWITLQDPEGNELCLH